MWFFGITMEYGNENDALFEIALGEIVGGRCVVVKLPSGYEGFWKSCIFSDLLLPLI